MQHTGVCNYAEDTTIYACNSDLETVSNRLDTGSSILAKWFSENCMKLDKEKHNFFIFSNKVRIQLLPLVNLQSEEENKKNFWASLLTKS